MSIEKNTSKIQRVALYIRVSTTEQVQEWYGLDSQDRILRAFVQSNEDKWWVTTENLIYRDEGYSWATDVDERPWLSQLRNDIIDWKIDVILVWKIDRLFRKTSYLLEYIDFLKKFNVNFVSKNENIDLSSSSWKLILTLLWAIGEMERDVISERTTEGKISKAMQWYFVYGKYVPYWYMLEDDGHGKRIKLNPETSEVVKEIFDMYTKEGKTTWDIARILTARWIGTDKDRDWVKKHKWLFRQSEIGDILRNDAYLWTYYCNKRSIKRQNGKQIATLKDPSEWVSIQIDSLIPGDTWKQAQEILSKAQIFQWRWKTHVFTGLVRCGECGKSYHYYKTQKGKGNYRCGWRNLNKVSPENYCDNWGISEDKLLSLVFPKIELLLQDPADFICAYEAEKWKNKAILEKDRFEKELLETNELIKKKELTKKDALRKTLEDPENTDLYKQIIIDISREIYILSDRKKNISREIVSYEESEKTYKAILDTAEKISNEIANLTEDMRIDIIRKLVEVVIVKKDSVEVVYKFKLS
jgi:site-specific DNA recombinase